MTIWATDKYIYVSYSVNKIDLCKLYENQDRIV